MMVRNCVQGSRPSQTKPRALRAAGRLFSRFANYGLEPIKKGGGAFIFRGLRRFLIAAESINVGGVSSLKTVAEAGGIFSWL